jgi:DNA repair protein RecO (recombination protein O)
MRHRSSDSFILATYPLREKDRIVSFLTRDAGKKRGVARGSRGARSHFGGLLEPMTEARVTYFEKDSQELVSINSVDAIRPSFALSKNLEQGLLVSALAESLQTFVPDSDPAEHFYRLARHVLDGLFAGASPRSVRSYFELWILKLSGLFPSPSECAACGKPLEPGDCLLFDPSRPGFIGPECRAGEVVRLSPAAAQTLRVFLSAPFDPAKTYKGVAEVSAVAGFARRHFLGHELKSQRVLSEVLGS